MTRKNRSIATLTGVLAATALTLTLTLTGCKEDPPPAPSVTTVNVTIKDGEIIIPRNLKKGRTKFVVKNEGTMEHLMEVENKTNGDERITRNILPGATEEVEYDLLPVEFEFYCPRHKADGEYVSFTIGE